MRYAARGTYLACLSFATVLSVLGIANSPVVAEESGEGQKVQPPHAGDAAPGFTLNLLGVDETVTLGDFAGKKDVVLVFGSYT